MGALMRLTSIALVKLKLTDSIDAALSSLSNGFGFLLSTTVIYPVTG